MFSIRTNCHKLLKRGKILEPQELDVGLAAVDIF